MDRTDAVLAVSVVNNPAAAYQKLICIIKEYTRAKDDHARAAAAVIPNGGFSLTVPYYICILFLWREEFRKEIISDICPVVRHLQKVPLELHAPVSFFVGENGVGKSTLIEAVAVAMGFNPEGGSRNFTFSTRQTHSDLEQYLRIAKGPRPKDGFFLRAESFYNVATNIEEMDEAPGLGAPVIDSYGGISLHKQSHGESFLALVQNRFGGNGLYILDEPEAALSPMRLMTLLCLIDELVKKQSQFLISTHSPILMAYPGAEVFEISENGIRRKAFWETEHYQITKRFLNDPEGMLQRLLKQSGKFFESQKKNAAAGYNNFLLRGGA